MKLIKKLPPRKDKKGRWISYAIFQCPNLKCNKEVEKRLGHGLRDKSCGCVKKELVSKAQKGNKNNYIHGEGHPGTKLYHVWDSMKQRCNNSDNPSYENYGGRGITICPKWAKDYIKFRDWALGNGYKIGLQINRINNNGNYEPSNCNWIIAKENTRNRRGQKIKSMVEANKIRDLYKTGKYTQKELAKKFGVIQQTISDIINYKRWKN